MHILTEKDAKPLIRVAIPLALLLYGVLVILKFSNYAKLTLFFAIAPMSLLYLLSISRFTAFQLFIVTLPLESVLLIDVGFIIRPAFLTLIFLIFIMLALREFWYSKSPLDIALFAFLGICTLSLIQNVLAPPPSVQLASIMKYRSGWYRSILQLFLLYFFSLAYFFTVYLCSKDKRKLDIAVKTYVIMAIVISSYGIYQAFASHFGLPLQNVTFNLYTRGLPTGHALDQFVGTKFAVFRSRSTFGEPLGLGHYLLSVLPMLIAFGIMNRNYIDLQGHKWLKKSVLILVILLLLVLLFMTRSRGALAGFATSIFTLIILLQRKHLPRFLAYFFASIFALAIFYFVAVRYLGLSKSIMQVLRLRVGTIRELISNDRYVFLFELTPKLIAKHIFLGVGIGNFAVYGASMLGREVLFSPHGVWTTVLLETGVLGFATFCWMVIAYYRIMVKTLAKAKDTYWTPYIIGCIACFTGQMAQYLMSRARLDIYTWFFIGISMAIVRLIDQEQSQNLVAPEPAE